MESTVSSASIPEILKNIEKGSWLVPHFQRDFVWNTTAVRDLLASMVRGRPVGMITLWAQADDTDLPLEPISVPDSPNDEDTRFKYLVPLGTRTNKYFAILDGKQRCTSIAMAFTGLRPDNRKSRYCGRYFLDVNNDDPDGLVVYLKETEISKMKIESDRAAIGAGYYPFQRSKPDESLSWQWIRYIQELKNKDNYSVELSLDEIARRERILKRAYDGINDTRFAVLIVPDSYKLDEICDIFDKLNTTGTKVSTVDLIHSWLYADTAGMLGGPLNLRKWIRSMEEEDGAVGWADLNRRPELMAQFVTAAYCTLDKKPPPRQQGGAIRTISSIKSGDLLATPSQHWINIISRQNEFTLYLGDMQKAIIDNPFPWHDAPYPAASTIYFAIRWKYETELKSSCVWDKDDLNSAFRAFYWRNALASRYDQGVLTKVESDTRFLQEILEKRASEQKTEWLLKLEERINAHFKANQPQRSEIELQLKRGRLSGAAQKALLLPMVARIRKDLLNPKQEIGFPDSEPVEIHHFFPSAWCSNNKHLNLNSNDDDGTELMIPQSIVNLFPLSRTSNNDWKACHPAQIFSERNITFDDVSSILIPAGIDSEAFDMAAGDRPNPMAFWERRSRLYAEQLIQLMRGV